MELTPKEQAVLNLIKKDSAYENYFFRKVSNLKWFVPLKENGYFSPGKAPGYEEAEEKDYFTIPEWNVLPYLERVSQQVTVEENKEYADELLNIINDVTEYHIKHKRKLDNYRTWWCFVKMLLNIPNEKIAPDIIELIPIWLDSKFNNTLVGSKIATKLLPKFLPDEPTAIDVKKAEKIVDYVTRVKWNKLPEELRKGILGKEEELKTIIDTYWLMESFINQKNAIKVGEKCSENSIYLIANKLKEIFRRLHPDHWRDIEDKGRVYYVVLSHTKDYEFDFSIETIEKNQLKADKEKDEFLEGSFNKSKELLKFEIRDCKNIECFTEKIKSEILKSDIAEEIKFKFEEKIKHLYEGVFNDYSYIWFKSISLVPEFVHGTEVTLALILRDVLLAKVKKDKLGAQNIFKNFQSDKYQYPLFKRLVLFVIGECWTDFKEEFWKTLDDKDGERLFDDSNYEAEIYTLLEKNIGKFTQQEKEKLKEIIEKGPQRYLPEDNKDKYISYWKQKWYSAVKTDQYFTPLYEEQKRITEIEEEVNFKGIKVRWAPDLSPLSKEDILSTPNKELAEFLKTFKTKDFWKGPTIEGLAKLLKVAVQEKPEKFIDNVISFLNTGYYYIYEIFWGIRDAWNEKKTIDWNKLFNFIKKYISRKEFWQDKFKMANDDHWDADHRLVIGMIGELIQEGTKDDNWAFAENYLTDAQEIIFLIIDNLKIKDEEQIGEPVTDALNTAFGKTITALIYLALRIARLEDKKAKKRKIKWSNELKGKYENLLKGEVIEAYTLLGQYMPNLYYLDKSWVEQKIKDFQHIKKEQSWFAFMDGYLFDIRVRINLYKLMREHYLKALSYSFKERNEKGLVQHIALGYLRDIEDFSENSLFGILVKEWNYSRIKELIGFFWMQREYPAKSIDKDIPVSNSEVNEKLKNKIIEFWEWLYEKYKDKESLNEDDKKILSAVAELTVFLPKIDNENIEWLKLSAQYVHLDFNSPFFIEYLDELKDKGEKIESGKYVGKIYLKMLESSTPYYDEKHIRSIVEYLYELKDKETIDLAIKICNMYVGRQFDFLRDIYEKNKNLKSDR